MMNSGWMMLLKYFPVFLVMNWSVNKQKRRVLRLLKLVDRMDNMVNRSGWTGGSMLRSIHCPVIIYINYELNSANFSGSARTLCKDVMSTFLHPYIPFPLSVTFSVAFLSFHLEKLNQSMLIDGLPLIC